MLTQHLHSMFCLLTPVFISIVSLSGEGQAEQVKDQRCYPLKGWIWRWLSSSNRGHGEAVWGVGGLFLRGSYIHIKIPFRRNKLKKIPSDISKFIKKLEMIKFEVSPVGLWLSLSIDSKAIICKTGRHSR